MKSQVGKGVEWDKIFRFFEDRYLPFYPRNIFGRVECFFCIKFLMVQCSVICLQVRKMPFYFSARPGDSRGCWLVTAFLLGSANGLLASFVSLYLFCRCSFWLLPPVLGVRIMTECMTDGLIIS